MTGHLSHELNPWRVSYNRIIDSVTSLPIVPRGIVRSGLEYSPPLVNGITSEEIDEMVLSWGANIIRLPFNQDWALARPGYDPEPYLRTLDFVIDAAASRGAYTLLDLQWLDAVTPRGSNSDGTVNFVAPLPNLLSVELWRQLATRYSGESAVLYDVFNEPHDALPDDPVPLLGLRENSTTFALTSPHVSMQEWKPWATHLIATVRAVNPDALIFVSGIDWGYDLRGFPLVGVRGAFTQPIFIGTKARIGTRRFGLLADNVPVFAGEWGGGSQDVEWGVTLVQYMRGKNIGWTAWSWSDNPRLIDPTPGDKYKANAFGQIVRDSI